MSQASARAADHRGAEDNPEPGHPAKFSASGGIRDPRPGDAADPIRALLDRLDAAIARGGRLEVDGRTLLIRPVGAGCYHVVGRS